MPKHGKKYAEALKRFDATTPYPAGEAVHLVKSLSFAKFDETVEAVFKLGIDPRQADQLVRGSLSLPHGVGKQKKVIAFCPDTEIL